MLTGTVTDTSSAVVVNAQVTAINVATNFETATVTNAEGLYRIPFLRPGTYRVRITAPGFKSFIRENVELRSRRDAADQRRDGSRRALPSPFR